MDQPPTSPHELPHHGRISCRRCFADSEPAKMLGEWQVVNDPGAWGSATPSILVLGFSKGFTQANAYRAGLFEDIPFKDMRSRLTEMLRGLGLLATTEIVDQKMVAEERHFAFGSLVRCSLSRRNAKTGHLECTGQVMSKAFIEPISEVVRRCADTFLVHLPDSVRLVLMLGTTDAYVASCRCLMKALHPTTFCNINEVSYRAGKAVWAHVSHPSGLNGHHPVWMAGDPSTKPGRKRQLAMLAIEVCGIGAADARESPTAAL